MQMRWMLLAVVAWPTLAQAKTPIWSISEATGSVTVLHTGIAKIATRGSMIAPGDVVRTGVGGRAVLVHGQEYMMVAPGSQVRLPADAEKGAVTKLVEEAGNVVFMIKKMATPHFEVKTPYLAAVVKGTTFSVSVGDTGATVHVLEGAVDVATIDGGAHQMVLPGGSVSVGAANLDTMRSVMNGRETVLRSHTGGAATAQPIAPPRLTVSANVINEVPEIASSVAETPTSLSFITGGLVSDGPAVALTSASSSLKQIVTTQTDAREAQVSLQQAIVHQAAAADAAGDAAMAKADADAKLAAAASAERVFAEQTAKLAADQAADATAAKQAADQAVAQQAALVAAQQAQAAQQAAANAAAQEAAAMAAAAAKDNSDASAQQASQAAQLASAIAAKQAADAAAAVAAQQQAQQQAAQQAAAQQATSAAAAQTAAAQAAADKSASDAAAAASDKATKDAQKAADKAAKDAAKAASDQAAQAAKATKGS